MALDASRIWCQPCGREVDLRGESETCPHPHLCSWCGHEHDGRCEVDADNGGHPGAICGCPVKRTEGTDKEAAD